MYKETENAASDSIGKWEVGRNKCFTIYQGILQATYLIKESTGAEVKIYHDNTMTKMYRETTVTGKKIWIKQCPNKSVRGTYEMYGETKSKERKWYTEKNKVSDFAQGDNSGSVIYRICGPKEPPCDEHKIKKKGCKKCEIRKEDYNITVSVLEHGKNECMLYNNETSDASGIKITITGNGIPLRLTGDAFVVRDKT